MTNVADYAILITVATSVITLNKNLMTHKGAFYMSNAKHTITDSEYSIMKILWNSEKKMTVSDVVRALDGNDWTPSTVSTFLQRLLKKNVVSCEKKGNTNLYYPILKQNDYDMSETESFLSKIYKGSVKNLVAALYENKYAYRFAAKQPTEGVPSSERVLTLHDKMRRVCEQKNIRLITVLSPVYAPEMTEALAACYKTVRKALGNTVDFYDYSTLPFCADKRFFYNKNEFRTCLGNRILADIFAGEKSGFSLTDAPKETTFPILLYHHVTSERGYGDSVISASRLEEHLRALSAAGYTAVSLSEAEAFVRNGTPLPEKPICLTFDDGYESNAVLALPLLEKYNMKAAFFYIGWAVGKDSYKDTGKSMFEHFDFDTARKMRASGLAEFGSHTYDMHQSDTLETQKNTARFAVKPLRHELPSAFIHAVKDDCRKFNAAFEKAFGEPVRYLSYPHGIYSPLSESILAGEGITVTLSTESGGRNVLVEGLPQSLRALYLFTVSEDMTGSDLLKLIDTVYAP